MPNMETPYAEIKAVAGYPIKADQLVTALPGSTIWMSRGKWT